MKICFVVPDGVGLRNYLYSNIISHLPSQAELLIYTPLAPEIINEIKKIHPGRAISHENMPIYREPFISKLLKEAITYARLRHYTRLDNNPTTMINWTRKKHKGFSRVFHAMAAITGRVLLSSYPSILRFESLARKVTANSSFVTGQMASLSKMRPDVIFCTHQRSMDAAAITEAANQLGIPTIGAIYSWDNLPKARLLVRSRYFLTWSGYMKDEMRKYYPEIDENNIIVTGTPQFEFYFNPSLHVTREEFCNSTGLDPGKKILCFSGNDLTFPCDDLYLRDLAEELMKLPAENRPQVLLRRCPVDLSGRFDKVVADYPGLVKKSEPLWVKYKGGWDTFVPTLPDVALLVNVSLHADAVINVGSTMAHDFAVFGKPAIYINYDQPSVNNWSAVTNNQYQHFRSMPAHDSVIWLNNKNEINEAVHKALNGYKPASGNNQEWFSVIALQPATIASENIANCITRFANKH